MIKKILIATVLLFGLYVLLLQNTITERVRLEDERCIVVNPLVIKRKKLYLSSMKALFKNTGQYSKINDEYIETSKLYHLEEEKWLKKDLDQLQNPLVKLLVNKDGFDGAILNHRIIELEYINSKLVTKLLETDEPTKLENLNAEIDKNVEEGNKATEAYDKLTKTTNLRFVDRLIRIPEQKCPPENYDIPDVWRELQKIMTPEASPKDLDEGLPS